MDIEMTEEQRMIADSLARLLREAGEEPDAAALWGELADLGMLALNLPEAQGGLGLTGGGLLAASRELGRSVCAPPWMSAAGLGGALVSLLPEGAAPEGLAGEIASGAAQVAVSFHDAGHGYDLAFAARAEADGAGFRLSGHLAVTPGADTATHLLIPATAGGEAALFLIGADQGGVARQSYALVDGRGAADIRLDGAQSGAPLLTGEAARALLAQLWDIGAVCMLGEADGALEEIMALCAAYLNERRQFGQPLGQFQALQHMLAESRIDREHLRSLILDAANGIDADAETRARAVSAAKVYLSDRGRKICERAIQMHGGIGMTDEYRLGRLVKRVVAAEFLFGDHDLHLDRYGLGAAA